VTNARSSTAYNENRLLPDLEHLLGPYEGEGVAEPKWNVPFSAFLWTDAPEIGARFGRESAFAARLNGRSPSVRSTYARSKKSKW
jgi:hypothetical protein